MDMITRNLSLVINAIVAAIQESPSRQEIKVYMRSDNGLDEKSIYPQQLYDILLKLQNNDKILTLKSFPLALLPNVGKKPLTGSEINSFFDYVIQPSLKHFIIEIHGAFDDWYDNYLGEWEQMNKKNQPVQKNETVEPATTCEIIYTSREIMLNGTIRLSRPDFNGENERVFRFLYDHPNQKFSKNEIEQETGNRLQKSFHKIVENLGFTGELKKRFFDVAKDSIQFKNPIN
jgi:hypothetical protein